MTNKKFPEGIKNQIHLEQHKRMMTKCPTCGFSVPHMKTFLFKKVIICENCYIKATQVDLD